MLLNTFLRTDGDPSVSDDLKDPKNPEFGDPNPDADPQDGDPKDPDKSGFSAEEKAELENLRKDKETLSKRLSDTQESFRKGQEDLKLTRKQIHDLKNHPIKSGDQYSNDPEIHALDERIKAYKGGLGNPDVTYDTSSLEALKSARIREINLEKRLISLENRGRDSDDMGNFLLENPDVNDLTPAGQAKAVLTDRGEKVSIETAHFYQKGKNYEADLAKAVEAGVAKALEAKKKANGARGQEGDFAEPVVEVDKEMTEYANLLTSHDGDILQ